MIALAYRAASDLAAPLLRRHLARRVLTGKEEASRLDERYGIAILPRPEGRLGWLHAASVGEMQSLLPLVEALAAREPDLHFLVTTGTVTSAGLLARRRLPRVIHQYLPLDRQAWVARFLDHWQPDFALWVESEFWPNLLREAARRRIPMALVNGRLSARSLSRWAWAPGFVAPLIGSFCVVLAQDEIQGQRLAALGARQPRTLGNLKFAAAAPGADEAMLARLTSSIGGRPVWLAVSTHTGEEGIVVAVHRSLKARYADLLTIVAPRHVERAEAITSELRAAGLSLAQRSKNEPITDATDIYLADTLGELGLFYRLARVVLVAGSYRWQGHNPIEPALLHRAVISGPRVANFQDIFDRMTRAGAVTIADEAGLAEALDRLLQDPEPAARSAEAFARKEGEGILARIVAALEPVVGTAGRGKLGDH